MPADVDPPPIPRGVHTTNFGLLWAAQTVAVLGARIGYVGLPVLAVQLLKASEAQVGYLTAASTVAFLLVGLPAGAWVDRWLKRPTMLLANLVRALAAGAVPVLWLTGHLGMVELYAIQAVLGFGQVFFDVAYQSFLPVMVKDGEIGEANARLETTSQLAMTGGPAVGGLMLKVLSAPMLMAATGLGYLFSFALLLVTRDGEAAERAIAPPRARLPLWTEVREGLGFVWRHDVIRGILLCNVIGASGGTLVWTLLPLLALRELSLDGFTFGLVMTVGSLGGFLGALLTPRLRHRVGEGSLIFSGMVVSAFGLLLTPLAGMVGPRWLSAAWLMLAGFVGAIGSLLYNILQVSLRQRLCPRPLLGRMNASIRFVTWGAMPFAALIAGWLGGSIGVRPTMLIGAVAAFVSVVPIRWFRRADFSATG